MSTLHVSTRYDNIIPNSLELKSLQFLFVEKTRMDPTTSHRSSLDSSFSDEKLILCK